MMMKVPTINQLRQNRCFTASKNRRLRLPSTSHFPFHVLQRPILMSVYVYANKQKHRMRSSQSYEIETFLSINLLSRQYLSAYIKMIRTLC